MKISGFGKLLATTYTDKLSINRYGKVDNPDGTTGTKLPDIPVYTDIPCRLSFNQEDNPETSKQDVNPIYLQIKVFCGVGVDIRKGDFIEVEKLADDGTVLALYKGTANLPLVYTTHKEILFAKVGDA
jgi:hypothetical protein